MPEHHSTERHTPTHGTTAHDTTKHGTTKHGTTAHDTTAHDTTAHDTTAHDTDQPRTPAHHATPYGRRARRGVTAAGSAVLLVSALAVPAAGASAAAGASPAPGTTAPRAAGPVPQRYLTQRIAWAPCYSPEAVEELPGAERLQCGSFRTPRDWQRPGAGKELRIAVSRLNPAAGRAPRTVLTNPGGPGGPGLSLPLVYLDAKRTALTGSREIVGMDPRGTGRSSNVTCEDGAAIGSELDPRDRSEGNLELLLDSAALTARFCQTGDRALSPYITTEQTVRDLDLLRALLGRDTVDWIGYSGGTWLGAAYATYFPQRVGRFVLDANTDFTADWQKTFGLQPKGFERRWRSDFLPWVAAQPSTYGLGSTPKQVLAGYEALRARAARDPIDLAGLLQIGPTALDGAVLQAMYSKDQFAGLAQDLVLLRELADEQASGAAPAPLSAARAARVRRLAADVERLQRRGGRLQPLAAPDAGDAVFTNVLCNDTPWQGTRRSLVEASAEQARRHPLLGPYVVKEPCVFWDRAGLDTLAPRTGEGVPPVLMVQNDKDPATPVEGARHARRTFRGAKMITVVNEGNHATYPGNPCVDAKVEAFLLRGVPAADATCLSQGLPPVQPEPGRRLMSRRTDTTPSPLQRNQRLAERAGLR